jgi:hypothetical protein
MQAFWGVKVGCEYLRRTVGYGDECDVRAPVDPRPKDAGSAHQSPGVSKVACPSAPSLTALRKAGYSEPRRRVLGSLSTGTFRFEIIASCAFGWLAVRSSPLSLSGSPGPHRPPGAVAGGARR